MFAQIVCIVCASLVCLVGFCLLGSRNRLKRSYFQLRTQRTTCCVTAVWVPLLLFGFFASLAIVALWHTPLTDRYFRTHSLDVFNRADSNHDQVCRLSSCQLFAVRAIEHVERMRADFHEFTNYMVRLDSPNRANDTHFRVVLSRVFDFMDKDDQGFVTEVCGSASVVLQRTRSLDYILQASMEHGVHEALEPARLRFGIAMGSAAVLTLILTTLYWGWYKSFERAGVENELPRAREGDGLIAHADEHEDEDDEELDLNGNGNGAAEIDVNSDATSPPHVLERDAGDVFGLEEDGG